ncbi:HlyD family efflux transporter periplasmic adaptor subunit [Undibacterium sp. TS12]|uniref:HlyD family efflux transporter periplasmic adaptor subunit n=1 Tax=Undibacterium sp. TS12 TaxID=2908202 RepID=UPI001F4C8472|nr:HlyD family efflux transporter periplasmic adaptor subunit [Undibacterium sp. TS12]MCH8622333.1 HlyD family efflux transporter periplasmic adaptor subunit [Undibacterium sp. TS12]
MTTSNPLFRPEVTATLGSQWMGAIRLNQPVSASLVAIAALLIAAALIAYISFGSITKKARVTGITVPAGGQLSVAAPNAGILLTTHIKEGEQVKAGQVLFTISTERQNSQGEITALVAQQLATRADSMAAEQRLRQNQYQEKKQALQQRLLNLSQEQTQLEQELLLAQRRQQLAQQSLSKYETLQTNGYVSAAQTQQKQEDLLDISTRLSTLQRNKTQLQASQIALQSELDTLSNSLATDLTQIERAKASLKQEAAENANRQAVQITAAQAGTVTGLTNQPGQAINAGQVLASLLPANDTAQAGNKESKFSELEVHLYAPSRTAGFITPGQQVLIRYAAFPYQKFGLHKATVTDVSRTPFAPAELPQNLATTILSNAQQAINGFNTNEALYRIKVRLNSQSINAYGQAQAIKPGMTLEADVLQDRRRIWEWVLEPVLAMTQRA